MRLVLIAGVASVLLAGCQSASESMYNAESACRQAGLKTGTNAFQRCVDANYNNSRRQSEQATNAAVLAGAAGVVGGAVLGANSRPYYSRPYYYRCRGWGCY
ncbi:hypothetical protein WJT86_04400 [Microvirga sp. W0021]|uniref:Lipoprotein n=1 Tax=Hohaiivirga grylli TaxID=3133970 RepID=A0ABV0BJ57_9HYPH